MNERCSKIISLLAAELSVPITRDYEFFENLANHLTMTLRQTSFIGTLRRPVDFLQMGTVGVLRLSALHDHRHAQRRSAVFAVLIDPVLNLFHLDKVNLNPKAIEKKIGVFGEPMVIGLFIGMFIGIIGSIGHLVSLKTWGQIFYVAVSAGFAIPAGAALITSFNILGKPMLGLVFLVIPCSARPSSRRTRRTSSTPSIPQSSRRRQMRSCASSRPSHSQRSSRRCSLGARRPLPCGHGT